MAEGSELKGVEVDAAVAAKKPRPSANPIRRITLIALLLSAAFFIYGLVADRFTPFTDQAAVQAYVVSLAPDVSGRVTAVNVVDNQPVPAGKVLFTIDPERYQIALETAQAQLSGVGQAVGASTASLAAAEARLAFSQASLSNVQKQTDRVFELVGKGIRPKANSDEALASLNTAIADVNRARAEVEAARQNLGPQGASNPQIRQAQAAIRKAQRDLADTVVRAPSNGVVTNLQLASGRFVGSGQTALTFIDSDAVWIDAEFRENALEHIQVGNTVGIALDVRPGRVYPGKVESIGWAIDDRDADPQTGLPTIKNDTGWVREPQRFVVRVRMDRGQNPKDIRVGSQASIVIYTGRNALTDSVGRLWIRLVSILSYLN